MGYPASGELNIVYDSLQMEKESYLDTTQEVNYSNRIEYKLLGNATKLAIGRLILEIYQMELSAVSFR